ncbi:unnamed protein product [Mesocestoides corti]|uniref:Aminotransferase class I/classII large domain-containing protein n=1 Tax=Mesocestoides corti TaxID=53468 RepID=A0A0R3UA00_MESCO|nr:unnamed protein product [Mesocestoides corti]
MSLTTVTSVPPAKRTLGQKPSIWVSINELIAKHKPLNLGQGFPDFLPTGHVLESLAKATDDACDPSLHMLTRCQRYLAADNSFPPQGHPRLVNALSRIYTPLTRHDPSVSGPCSPDLLSGTFVGPERVIDAEREIIISPGAYGALCAAFFAVVNPGDEVIIIEPAFDCYTPMTLAVGGRPVYVPLRPPKSVEGSCSASDWILDFDELESKVTSKTKVLVLNTPNNPLGKVFSLAELEKLADICIRHNIVCFSDEVYEWIVFPPSVHIKIASLPGMWERTLTIGSAGKTFNVTGWKIGWTIGPETLISAMATIQATTVEACPTPMQEALATSLEVELPLLHTPQSYFYEITRDVAKKTEVLAHGLESVGMQPILPQGGYFLMANIEKIPFPMTAAAHSEGKPRDELFNEWMMENKDEKTLEKAISILRNW